MSIIKINIYILESCGIQETNDDNSLLESQLKSSLNDVEFKEKEQQGIGLTNSFKIQ